jgi:hypothetical protein
MPPLIAFQEKIELCPGFLDGKLANSIKRANYLTF